MSSAKMKLLAVMILSLIIGILIMYSTQNLMLGCFTSTLITIVYVYESESKKEH